MLKMKIDFININTDKMPKKSGYMYYFLLQDDKYSILELKDILKKYLPFNLRKGGYENIRKIRFCGMKYGYEENVGFKAQEEVGLGTENNESEYWSSCLDYHSLVETCIMANIECSDYYNERRYSHGHLTLFYDDINYVYNFFNINNKYPHLKRKNNCNIKYLEKETKNFCKYIRTLINNKKRSGYKF